MRQRCRPESRNARDKPDMNEEPKLRDGKRTYKACKAVVASEPALSPSKARMIELGLKEYTQSF